MNKSYKRAYRRHKKQTKYLRRLREVAMWFPFSLKSKEWYKIEEKFPTTAHRIKNHSSFFRHSDGCKKWYEPSKYRKYKYSSDIRQSDEEDIRIQNTWFENFCGTCLHFRTPECPFLEKFEKGECFEETEWKEIGCENFWD